MKRPMTISLCSGGQAALEIKEIKDIKSSKNLPWPQERHDILPLPAARGIRRTAIALPRRIAVANRQVSWLMVIETPTLPIRKMRTVACWVLPFTVAGPRRICTGLPFSHPLYG